MDLLLKCDYCSVEFTRCRGEFNRSQKRGCKSFCSASCASRYGIKINHRPKGNPTTLRANNRLDEYSMFRVFMNIAMKNHRNVGIECTITLEELKKQWEIQEGICPYTGWKLLSPKNTGHKRTVHPQNASLDRIDSSKGYVVGNIQYVSLIAQYGKNIFKEEDLLNFCNDVTNYRRTI